MKTRFVIALGTLALAGACWAQETGTATGGVVTGPRHTGKGPHNMMFKREMGKWWQNPDVVSKLALSDAQVTQLNQVFYNHKLKLIDYGADMEKQDLKLQTMLDADQPDEATSQFAGRSGAFRARQTRARIYRHESRSPQAVVARTMATAENHARRRSYAGRPHVLLQTEAHARRAGPAGRAG